MCYYDFIDGKTIHINDSKKLDRETKDALDKLVILINKKSMISTKLSKLPLEVRERFKGMTDDEKIAAIKKYEEEMSAATHTEIQEFVREQMKKGIKPRQIKKMVKKKFKVIIV